MKPGVCFHLLPARKWRHLEPSEKPEMCRVPLDTLCLQIHLLQLGRPDKFLKSALTPPSASAVEESAWPPPSGTNKTSRIRWKAGREVCSSDDSFRHRALVATPCGRVD